MPANTYGGSLHKLRMFARIMLFQLRKPLPDDFRWSVKVYRAGQLDHNLIRISSDRSDAGP